MAFKRGRCRASVWESLYYIGLHRLGLQGKQTCIRAVVQLPRVTLEAHPPRTDPPVIPDRQVWGSRDVASRIGEGCCLAALVPRGVEDYRRRRRSRNRHSYFLSEMVRPNVSKTLIKTAIIRPNPRGDGDRDTTHDTRVATV